MYLKICNYLYFVKIFFALFPFKMSVMYLCKFCIFNNGQFMFLKYIFVHIQCDFTPPPLRVSVEYSEVVYIY